MKRLRQAVTTVLLAALTTCSARSLEEEEPPPDIEGLCRGHCERVLECALSENAEFDDMEGCMEACRTAERWGPGCMDVLEDLLLCQSQFECPEFPEAAAEHCEAEGLANSNCRPDEDS